MTIAADRAETIALQALAHIAGSEDLRGVFLGSSGLAPEDLRARATDPELLGAVLDFLLMDDAWVIDFCDANGLRYEEPAAARMALPGGAQTHWT